MGNVSRPLIGLLVATVAMFALWTVALKPSGSPDASSPQGLTKYQSAVAKARAAVATSKTEASTQTGGKPASTSPTEPQAPRATSSKATASTSTTATTATTTAATTATTATTPTVTHSTVTSPASKATAPAGTKPVPPRLDAVSRALIAKRAIALLFYNPVAADDQAIKGELAAVPGDHGRVLKLAVPITQMTRYPVTTQLQIAQSPTLVLIDRHHDATTIVGFADRFEIAQRVLDALAAK
jgi:hypothetical protein